MKYFLPFSLTPRF